MLVHLTWYALRGYPLAFGLVYDDRFVVFVQVLEDDPCCSLRGLRSDCWAGGRGSGPGEYGLGEPGAGEPGSQCMGPVGFVAPGGADDASSRRSMVRSHSRGGDVVVVEQSCLRILWLREPP